jgi:hypothetical protein
VDLPESPVPNLRLPDKPGEMDPSDYELLLGLARKIVRRRLTVPAIFFLETAKPLNYIGAQAMVFFGPFVQILFESPNYYRYTELLEERTTLELLLRMVEELESEEARREKLAREKKREEKSKTKTKRPFWKFWA